MNPTDRTIFFKFVAKIIIPNTICAEKTLYQQAGTSGIFYETPVDDISLCIWRRIDDVCSAV